jgi:hypothetical protein
MRIGLQGTFMADEGKQFVLTEHGYRQTPQSVKPERAIGQPIKGHETSVPKLWVGKHYVVERPI